jgi:anti-sigma factor RsiW
MWSPWAKRNQLSCRDLTGMVTDYLEGALSRRDKRRFEGHLKECLSCPEYVDQIRAIVRAAGRPDPDEPAGPTDAELAELFRTLRGE